jgi:hypothetical protein
MRLSEAMRLGSMLRPQGFGRVLTHDGKSCALGAAYDAIGELRPSGLMFKEIALIRDAWPVLHQEAIQCPACAKTPRMDDGTFSGNITHLNDDHRWTREQIADWVETLESARQPADALATSADAVAGTVEEPQAVPARMSVV